jgi:hypothetical protein
MPERTPQALPPNNPDAHFRRQVVGREVGIAITGGRLD